MASRALPRMFGILSLLWVYAFFLGESDVAAPAPNPGLAASGAADSFLVSMDKGDGVDDEPDACHSAPEDRHAREVIACVPIDSGDPIRKGTASVFGPAFRIVPSLSNRRLVAGVFSLTRDGSASRSPLLLRCPVFLISDLPPPLTA
jgi:hypothetical protein